MKNQIGLAYFGFIILGIATSLLGVAWPSIRDTFALPLDAVGILLVAGTIGYLTASFLSGRLLAHFQVGHYITFGFLLAALGLLGQSTAPHWPLLITAGLIAGFGTGVIDAGLNIYVAAHYSTRHMNWLHASFGIGATLGPLLITAVLNNELSWRLGYLVTALLYALTAIIFQRTHHHWHTTTASNPTTIETRVKYRQTLRHPLVWLGIFIFFVYSGVEVSAGQWAYPLFTESRGIAANIAGIWVSIYWGTLTIGRFLFGFITEHIGVHRLLQASMIGVLFGAILMWLPNSYLGFIGLALIGLAQAPIFPTLISETPQRIGQAHSPNAIGFQVGAAGFGTAILPSLAGLLADSTSLEIIGPFLTLIALAMLLLYEYMARQPHALANTT